MCVLDCVLRLNVVFVDLLSEYYNSEPKRRTQLSGQNCVSVEYMPTRIFDVTAAAVKCSRTHEGYGRGDIRSEFMYMAMMKPAIIYPGTRYGRSNTSTTIQI